MGPQSPTAEAKEAAKVEEESEVMDNFGMTDKNE
jgi:hypothetical protein